MLNLAMLVEHHARLHPEREAVVSGAVRLSYERLNEMACRVAGALTTMGIRAGDHVALTCPNTPHFPIAYFGILKAGAAVVPLNVLLKPREIAQHLRDAEARAYLCFEGTAELPMGRMGYEAFGEVDGCEHFVVLTKDPAGPSPIEGAPTLSALLHAAPPTFPTVLRAPDDTAVILYTSGTTGRPKGAELTHANMLINAMAARDMFLEQLGTGPATALAVLPLFHSFGQTSVMNAHLFQGNRIVLLPRFEPAAVLETIVAEQVNAFAGVPTMYWALLRHAEEHAIDVGPIAATLRGCCSGGAAIPVEILRAFDARFEVEILEGYGLSETAPIATFNQVGRPRKPGSIGLPIWGCEVRVVGADDAEVPRGELGEVVVRGHNVMKGYYKQPAATAEVMRGGWFHTGDVGRMDDDGYLFITDRIKDLIIRGGMNVYPREVEEVLLTHPAVSLAAVIGVPHDEHGEEVKAYVVRRPGATVTEAELVGWARETMAAFKYPRVVEFADTLPMTATGKVLKRELRAAVDAALLPYPSVAEDENRRVSAFLGELRAYLDANLDRDWADEHDEVPAHVLAELKRLRLFGIAIPRARRGLKQALRLGVAFAKQRRQFGRAIAEFELIREKLARIAADAFAAESATYLAAGLADRGDVDYALEAAAVKVWTTNALGRAADELVQLAGGRGFVRGYPFERMYRDVRITRIFEGTNEVLRLLVGGAARAAATASGGGVGGANVADGAHPRLQPHLAQLAAEAGELRDASRAAVDRWGDGLTSRQLVVARLGDMAIELFVRAATLSRTRAVLGAFGRGERATAAIPEPMPLDAAAVERVLSLCDLACELSAGRFADAARAVRGASADALLDEVARHALACDGPAYGPALPPPVLPPPEWAGQHRPLDAARPGPTQEPAFA